ncbi:MAG: hypothetical protein IKK70_05220 [Clostridia bacterium]|nr:hypothetical protein [Clostridia bacterium]
MASRTKKQRSVSATSKALLLLGFAFFINPVPFGLDILPDVFGCIALYFGLTQLAYFDGSVEEARKCISYLFIVEFIHLLMMRSVFLTNISSNRMLAVTGFSIVQGILYVLIFKRLFDGISYLAMRNNFNKTLKCSDGITFLTMLAFFVRIAATLIPELIAILEMRLNITVDLEDYDTVFSIVSAKPLIVVMLSAISLGISIAWFVSLSRLLRTLHAESAEELDLRYSSEYTSRPEKVRIKKLRRAINLLLFALLFIIDVSVDEKRIIPASAMFFLFFIASFAFKDVSGFRQTKRLALPAFFLLLATEIFRGLLVPHGAIIIYETDIKIIIAAAFLALATMTACLLCVRGFLNDVRTLSTDLGGVEIPTTLPWLAYSAMTVFWSAGFVIPYFYPYISAPRLICAGIFIWQVMRLLGRIYDDEYERYSLYY